MKLSNYELKNLVTPPERRRACLQSTSTRQPPRRPSSTSPGSPTYFSLAASKLFATAPTGTSRCIASGPSEADVTDRAISGTSALSGALGTSRNYDLVRIPTTSSSHADSNTWGGVFGHRPAPSQLHVVLLRATDSNGEARIPHLTSADETPDVPRGRHAGRSGNRRMNDYDMLVIRLGAFDHCSGR